MKRPSTILDITDGLIECIREVRHENQFSFEVVKRMSKLEKLDTYQVIIALCGRIMALEDEIAELKEKTS